MAECDRVPSQLTDAAIAAAPMIERFYCRGGGSEADLRTDMSHAVEAVLDRLVSGAAPTPTTPRQRARWLRSPAYSGPDRRSRP